MNSIFSNEFKDTYEKSLNLVNHPELYQIESTLHEKCAKLAVESYKEQKGEEIPVIYRPGRMWDQILQSVMTYSDWMKEGKDSILHDALYRFYRTDLIFGHSGDSYIWDIQTGSLNFQLQVYMILRRFREFTRGRLHIDPAQITTTDFGQNIYVPWRNQKLTFKIIRHAYYFNRMREFSLLRDTETTIGELGSGAGELAILTKKIHPRSNYICFDLPETLMVATYNMLMTFPEKKIGLYRDFREKKRITRDDLVNYDIIMLPNWCIEWLADDTVDLFVNIGSLSEMDPAIIANYLGQIERVCHRHLYLINRNVATVQFGEKDVPVSEFPFSAGVEKVFEGYDQASDLFHMRYGMDYECNYWEYVFRFT